MLFTISVVLGVLKVLSIISITWGMVFLPILIKFIIWIAIIILGAIAS